MDIVKHLKDIVSSSQTENEVKDFLESMCNFLKSLQDEVKIFNFKILKLRLIFKLS